MRRFELFIKRFFDLCAASTLLLILSPVLLVVAIIIRVTMGKPVLFTQPRLGHHGKEFTIYKFRTMTNLLDESGDPLPDEARLTRIGKFLRSTTLDEIPELLNVIKGDMSAVGPRPLLVEYGDLYTDEQMRRHDMPPGMAGPVLASGRNALTWEEKFERDLWYVDHWSLCLDFEIIFHTAIRVIKREGTNAEGYATMPKFEGTKKNNHNEG